jgi:hypothetical protein
MNGNMRKAFLPAASLLYLTSSSAWSGAQTKTSPAAAENKVITEEDRTAAKLGSTIPVSEIGEPVSGVTEESMGSPVMPILQVAAKASTPWLFHHRKR